MGIKNLSDNTKKKYFGTLCASFVGCYKLEKVVDKLPAVREICLQVEPKMARVQIVAGTKNIVPVPHTLGPRTLAGDL